MTKIFVVLGETLMTDGYYETRNTFVLGVTTSMSKAKSIQAQDAIARKSDGYTTESSVILEKELNLYYPA